MSRGRRYEGEQKLNLKKVFAVPAIIIIIVLLIVAMKQIFKADKATIAKKNIELNYFAVYTEGNWGVINSSGETIIQPTNGEMIEIPNKAKPVFVCTYDVNADGTYKTKALNANNQQIFTGYENVYTLQNFDGKMNLWYETNTLKVQKDGKYGLIDIDGKEILPCEYDNISTLKQVKDSIVVNKGNQVGLVNSSGKTIIPTEYVEIQAIKNDSRNGYIVKNADSKYGVINADGDAVLECKFDAIKNIKDNKNYIVNEAGTWKVLSENGAIYLEGKVASAEDMSNGNVIVEENDKYGIINLQVETRIPAEYEDLEPLFDDKYIAKKDGKYGIININNDVLLDYKYTDIVYNGSVEYLKAKNENGTYDYYTKDISMKFTAGEETSLPNGFIAIKVGTDVKYYNYKLEEKVNKDVYTTNTLFVKKENGKYGFVDKDGKVVVEIKYDDATEQNDCGYVAVKKDGKWGAIDQEGNIIVEPKYNLDNNESIDFIGKWHICADSNASYYTDEE